MIKTLIKKLFTDNYLSLGITLVFMHCFITCLSTYNAVKRLERMEFCTARLQIKEPAMIEKCLRYLEDGKVKE